MFVGLSQESGCNNDAEKEKLLFSSCHACYRQRTFCEIERHLNFVHKHSAQFYVYVFMIWSQMFLQNAESTCNIALVQNPPENSLNAILATQSRIA